MESDVFCQGTDIYVSASSVMPNKASNPFDQKKE